MAYILALAPNPCPGGRQSSGFRSGAPHHGSSGHVALETPGNKNRSEKDNSTGHRANNIKQHLPDALCIWLGRVHDRELFCPSNCPCQFKPKWWAFLDLTKGMLQSAGKVLRLAQHWLEGSELWTPWLTEPSGPSSFRFGIQISVKMYHQ